MGKEQRSSQKISASHALEPSGGREPPGTSSLGTRTLFCLAMRVEPFKRARLAICSGRKQQGALDPRLLQFCDEILARSTMKGTVRSLCKGLEYAQNMPG